MPKLFTRTHLIADTITDYWNSIYGHLAAFLDSIVVEELKARNVLTAAICDRNCSYAEARTGLLLKQLEAANLWPYSLLGRNSLRTKLNAMRQFSYKTQGIPRRCSNARCVGVMKESTQYIETKVAAEVARLETMTCGACLTCVKEDGRFSLDRCCEHAKV